MERRAAQSNFSYSQYPIDFAWWEDGWANKGANMKYEKGDKFIIEIESILDEQVGLYKVKGFRTLVFDNYGLDRLEQVWEQEKKWCEDCEYAEQKADELPCRSCSLQYVNRWTPKTEEIQVGDEVKFTNPNTQEGEYGVVIKKYDTALGAIDRDLIFRSWDIEDCKRTGKAYPELIKALESLPKDGE